MPLNANYVVRETTANLTRNITLTVASILTIFVSLAIVGTAVLVRQGAENMTQRFKGDVEFIVYVNPDISQSNLAAVRKSLQDNPGVRKAKYVDRKEAYAAFQKLFKDQPSMLNIIRPQDLPTSFRVSPTNSSVENVSQLVRFYRRNPSVYEVAAATDVLRQMTSLTGFVNTGLSVFAAFLLAASGLLILNTIRTAMFARRREIEVMKLVGATNWFVRIPFLLEGLVQGVVGGAMAIGFVFVARNLIDDQIRARDSLALLESFSIAGSDVVLACVVVGVTSIVLSVVSSALATRRFLDV